MVVTRLALSAGAAQTAAAFAGSAHTRAECWVARSDFSGSSLLRLWGNWDTGFYDTLALRGYPVPPATNLRPWAFQPLYPLLMRVTSPVVGGRVFVAGLLISLGCLVVTCRILHRLVLLDADPATAWRAVWFFLALPGSFLLSAVLTESLFTVLVVGAFHLARTRRWLLACILVALASVTRTIGLLVALPLLVEYAAQHGWSLRRPSPSRLLHPGLAAFALTPAGLALFAVYAHARTGDALIFQHVQFTQWRHRAANPLRVLWSSAGDAVRHPQSVPATTVAVTLVWAAASLAGTALGRLRASYLLYTLILVLVPLGLGTSVWQGMYRFLAPAFPMAVLLATMRNRTVGTSVLLGLALFQGMLMTLWTTCWTGVVI